MLTYGSFSTLRLFGTVALGRMRDGMSVFFSVFRFLLGTVFTAALYIIGRKSDKPAAVIAFSAVNILIALVAFIPGRRFYTSTAMLKNIFRFDAVTGMFCVLPLVFTALIVLFTVLTMLSALKKDRRRPTSLRMLILVVTGVYALYSVLTIFFSNPLLSMRTIFRGTSHLNRMLTPILNGYFSMGSLLNFWRETAHILYPFTTIAVFLGLYFAAGCIRPANAPVPHIKETYTAPAPQPEYTPQPVKLSKPDNGASDPHNELLKLDKMRADGLITHEEYYTLRMKIGGDGF